MLCYTYNAYLCSCEAQTTDFPGHKTHEEFRWRVSGKKSSFKYKAEIQNN
jgi:hypothetical protein